ncbi:Methyltransferase type [Parasponia andersonii]|uniref:Methyltransferase type n=1 Tax=Parasponia andersonii TaxID=3476 RepID=A0A2P5AQA0_PARAD|nr:Methyltransferase type [Parasponia andersonii]
MGTSEEDYYHKKQPNQSQATNNRKHKLQMLIVVVFTNLVTLYIFAGPSLNKVKSFSGYTTQLTSSSSSFPLLVSNSLSQELNTTREQLVASQSLIAELNEKLNSSNLLVQALLVELARKNNEGSSSTGQVWEYFIEQTGNIEVKLAVGPHKLPLGKAPTTGSDDVYPTVGAGCLRLQEELAQYLTYDIGGECPVDDVFAQRLMLKGCEPLPRRRCRPKSPVGYKEPTPVPDSLWSTPPDSSIIWDPYTCKSYQCLIDRKKMPGIYDCKDCFDLEGREKSRWLYDNGALDYGIDQVLAMKPPGTIRIGLDIGGGSGTFAARMRERNVTIITSSMNFDGPFNSFIASRGLIPIHVSVSHRLPFFENTLDIVHSMHVLSNWIPDTMLEFILYDIYRVLRPGGLFWLDHFFCIGHQLNGTYIPIIDRIGFNKLRWNVGMKLDRGADKNEWYFSALLEKPMT